MDKVIDLTASVRTIEKSTVSVKSRGGYIGILASFIVFLYGSSQHQNTLTANAIAVLDVADKKDKEVPTADKSNDDQLTQKTRKRKRSSRKKKAREENKSVHRRQPNLYSEAKRLLGLIERGNIGSSPIILTGDNRLSYICITSFMSTKKKRTKVNKHLAAAYQKNALGSEVDLVATTAEEEVDVLVRMSESTYGSIQSAISFLYRETGIKAPDDLSGDLSRYMKGSKRVGKSAKQSLGLSLDEGKKPMSKNVYSKLCEWLFQSNDKEHIFAHLFLVLDWYVFVSALFKVYHYIKSQLLSLLKELDEKGGKLRERKTFSHKRAR